MNLIGYAVNVLPKLKIGEDNEMESFVLSKKGKVIMANILRIGDGSIEIGRIKQKGFDVPEEIKPKPKYILVDEEGHEIVGERTREILEERAREIIEEEETKKGSFPSRILKKIFGRGRS